MHVLVTPQIKLVQKRCSFLNARGRSIHFSTNSDKLHVKSWHSSFIIQPMKENKRKISVPDKQCSGRALCFHLEVFWEINQIDVDQMIPKLRHQYRSLILFFFVFSWNRNWQLDCSLSVFVEFWATWKSYQETVNELHKFYMNKKKKKMQ